jgi:hypothetical protein
MGRFERFDRTRLKLKPLADRVHDLSINAVLDLGKAEPLETQGLRDAARRVISARKQGAAVILMIGAHVIRSGVQRYIIDMMERGYISLLAGNGASIIHDFEFSLIGSTTESVARYIKTGEFGLWTETGKLNDTINSAFSEDPTVGLGETVGKYILEGNNPYKDISLFAAAYRLGVPATVHVGMGYDIIHEHPNCDGAATGALSYNDFLYFARVVENIEGGALLSFGSSVMAPEVFLKALSMARNAAGERQIRDFLTLVCDIVELPDDLTSEPPRSNSVYYFRPFKTLLVRTVADGGISRYVKAHHARSIPGLWKALGEEADKL